MGTEAPGRGSRVTCVSWCPTPVRHDRVARQGYPRGVADRNRTKVLLVGAGGHARVLLDVLLADDREVVGAAARGTTGPLADGVPMLGSDEEAPGIAREQGVDQICVAIGDNAVRRRISQSLEAAGLQLVSTIHPSAVVAGSVHLAGGVQILPAVVVNARARLGKGTIVNSGAVIEHDARIGEYCHIAPGAVLGGDVVVGDGTLLGIGSRVVPGVTIGREAVVGAGATVIRDVPDGHRVAGVPAQPLAQHAEESGS